MFAVLLQIGPVIPRRVNNMRLFVRVQRETAKKKETVQEPQQKAEHPTKPTRRKMTSSPRSLNFASGGIHGSLGLLQTFLSPDLAVSRWLQEGLVTTYIIPGSLFSA